MTVATLADGRKLTLPDSLTDAEVDAVVRQIVQAESSESPREKAAAAKLAREMAEAHSIEQGGIAGELAKLNQGIQKLVDIGLAETHVTQRDSDGGAIASRKII